MSRRATKNLPWAEGWLTAWWGRDKHEGESLRFGFPRKPDGHWLYDAFCSKGYDENGSVTRPSLVEELEARGYDITTLEFRIRRKPKDEDR